MNKKYCTQCGTQLNAKDAFCRNCGKKCKSLNCKSSVNHESFSNFNRTRVYDSNSMMNGRMRAAIPHFGGISEIREDSLVIRKTNQIIPIKDITNFSLHQSDRTLWSDVKVDFDYNGLHYRTQQAGSDKGRLQTVERKINAREMNKLSCNINSNEKDKIEKLKDLKELLNNGIIDESEFEKLKDEIINGN